MKWYRGILKVWWNGGVSARLLEKKAKRIEVIKQRNLELYGHICRVTKDQ